MANTWTWEQVISNIEGIAAKTTGSSSVTGSGKFGADQTNGMWMYIPANGYYSTSHLLKVPWANCSSLFAASHKGLDFQYLATGNNVSGDWGNSRAVAKVSGATRLIVTFCGDTTGHFGRTIEFRVVGGTVLWTRNWQATDVFLIDVSAVTSVTLQARLYGVAASETHAGNIGYWLIWM